MSSQMKSELVQADFKKLNNFLKQIAQGWYVDVGIMGKKTNREDGEQTNAEIGFIHEFGTNKIPMRSFLRAPLFAKTEEILQAMTGPVELKKMAEDFPAFMTDLGIACEAAIQEAFDSKGFGEWAADAESTIKRKGSSSPLIDTKQLRFSITSAIGHS